MGLFLSAPLYFAFFSNAISPLLANERNSERYRSKVERAREVREGEIVRGREIGAFIQHAMKRKGEIGRGRECTGKRESPKKTTQRRMKGRKLGKRKGSEGD